MKVYHNTTIENYDSILKDNNINANDSKFFGKGIYFTAKPCKNYGKSVIEADIKLDKILEVEPNGYRTEQELQGYDTVHTYIHNEETYFIRSEKQVKSLRGFKRWVLPIYDKKLFLLVKEYATIDLGGVHGLEHWDRVKDNGLRLAEKTGADKDVIKLFALFHDSKRENNGTDPEHGTRGAELAKKLRKKIKITNEKFAILYETCRDHTSVIKHNNPTIATCWDADRLDIERTGNKLNKQFLNY